MGIAETPRQAGGTTPDVPPPQAAAPGPPQVGRRGWKTTLAPNLVGLFLWVVFFDQVPEAALRLGGVGWPILGAGLAGLLCYGLLYRTPVAWGVETGRPLSVLATSTFGVRGAVLVPGLLLTSAQLVWLAVSTLYGTALFLRALVMLQLLDAKAFPRWGDGTPVLSGALFMVVSLVWCFAASFVGRYLVRVIAALMIVYPIFPALILVATTFLAFKGVGGFQADPAASGVVVPWGMPHGLLALVVTVQMIFSFFATAGLQSADWGAVTRDADGARWGGVLGVVVAPWVVTTLAVLTVAGASPRSAIEDALSRPDPAPMRYSAALEWLAGGRPGGLMLMVFGIAALAPACYASFVFTTRLHEVRPGVSRTIWTVLAASIAWLLVVNGCVSRLFDVFSVLGAVLTPVAGAMTADRLRSGWTWPGPRRGYNRPGLLAWSLGVVVGLAPSFAVPAGVPRLAFLQPASLLACLLATLTYLVSAALGAESVPDALPELRPTPTPLDSSP